MTTETLYSAPITNRDATPSVANNAGVSGGLLRQSVAFLEVAAKTAASYYHMLTIPSNATGIELIFACDDLGTTATVDVGLFDTTANGGVVVDADFFASAIDCNAAALAPFPIQHESAVYGLQDIEKPLWEALGLSADSLVDYDVVITSVGAIDQAGTMNLSVRYAV